MPTQLKQIRTEPLPPLMPSGSISTGTIWGVKTSDVYDIAACSFAILTFASIALLFVLLLALVRFI